MAAKTNAERTGPTRRSSQGSIGTRLFFYVVSGALIGLGGMSYFFYRVLEDRTYAEIAGHLRVKTTSVERDLARAEAATVGFSAAIKGLKRLDLKDVEAYKSLTFEFYKLRPPLVMGLGFGQLPFQIVPGTQWFYPYFYLDQGAPDAIGSRLPPPYENVRYGDMFTLDNYPEQDYFKISSKAAAKVWLEPYDWSNITMTSFFEPCFGDDGKLAAVVVADVNVTALATAIDSPVIQGVGYFAIVSEKGNLLAFPPDPEKARVRANVESMPTLRPIWGTMTSNEEGIHTDDNECWAYRRIANTKWVMFASVPRAAIIRPVLRIAIGASLSAGVLLACAVFLFVRHLNRRLQPIVTACETLVGSNAQRTSTNESGATTPRPLIQLGKDGGDDELGVLARSFDQMSREIYESFTALERANTELEERVEERTAFLKQLNGELLESQKKLEGAREIADSANRAKSEFLASMSHELRTPLNGILGYSQILHRKKSLSDDDRRGVEIIQRSGEHLLVLISDILDLAKIEARRLDLSTHDVLLLPLLENVVELCRVRATPKGLFFKFEPSADLPRAVRVDEKRLRQILINLLGNAVKFTSAGGVTFSVSKLEANKLRFRIEDTGPGIDAHEIERIFIPFEQIKQGGPEHEGTGLGLAITAKIAALMGGKIQVESTVGKGSTFWFDVELPEVTLVGSPNKELLTLDVDGYEDPRRTILVVDDNAINRSLLTDTLQPLGFTVVEAIGGQSGLDVATREHVDMIITDLAMPDMDGLEMVRRIRELPKHAKTPIIVSSASVFAADQHRSVDAGANDFLSKPVNMHDLLQKLEKLLSLQWVRRKTNEDKPTETSTPASATPIATPNAEEVLLSATELDSLLDLVKRGRVNVLIEHARRLEQANASYAPFVMTLTRMARAFQLQELTALLERHRARRDAVIVKEEPSA
jgi:signal transduction histidine kinase/DNA-binding response OmpR family regulator